ncbi:MAG: hypothetical protein A3G81_12595 [Betaproteobacteria bacterium RIFCSPLOWO2_12_FULL_65_14]|nr:MAG: hypothetical protein A3G81_12595 [Betaproteobacteria bacterium RIFCSPLOWO2_12_FULL_65_14]
MQLESAKYLEDIRQASQTVVEATAGRTLTDYLGDKLLRLAVERCFEIIGEALRLLDERDHETASKITDFLPRSRRCCAGRQATIASRRLCRNSA